MAQEFGSLLRDFGATSTNAPPLGDARDFSDFGARLQQLNAPQDQQSKPSTTTTDPASVELFVRSVEPSARRVSERLGVPVDAVIGQWGLETGWGKSIIPGTNNLGNIKDTSGAGVAATDNQTGSRDRYRQYGSVDQFADDFTGLLGNERYKSAVGTKDAQSYFSGLKAGGYAEDQAYVQKGTAAAQMAASVLAKGGQPKQATAPDLSKAPAWGDIMSKQEFQDLSPVEQVQAKQAYFDHWIAPAAGAQATSLRERFLSQQDKIPEPKAAFGIYPSAMGANHEAAPAVPKVSVLQGAPAAEQLPTDSKAPVRPEVRAAFNAAWDAATPGERQTMAEAPGWQGMLARERTGQFERYDQGVTPTGQKLDPRAEARTAELIAKGEAAPFAQRAGQAGAARGVPPGQELRALDGTAQPSAYDFDTKQAFDPNAPANGLNNPLARGLAKGGIGMVKAAEGVNLALYDVFGADELAKQGRATTNRLRAGEQAIGERGDYMSRNLEGAISSIAQQLPMMVGGISTGSQAIPLAGMALQSFGQEYSDGRAQGQTVGQALSRASLFAAFEVIGERFGLKENMAAIKAAAKGMPADQIVGFLWGALKKEVPGEVLTTTGQFGADKLPGGVGLNPNATGADYLKQVADTIGQTIMQAGLMAGGTTGVSKAVQFLGQDQGGTTAAEAEFAKNQALAKWDTLTKAGQQTQAERIAPTMAPVHQEHQTSQDAQAIVAELAQQVGLPIDTVLPKAPELPNQTASTPAASDGVTDILTKIAELEGAGQREQTKQAEPSQQPQAGQDASLAPPDAQSVGASVIPPTYDPRSLVLQSAVQQPAQEIAQPESQQAVPPTPAPVEIVAYQPAIPQPGLPERIIETAKQEASRFSDLSDAAMYPNHVLQRIFERADAGMQLRNAAGAELTRRQTLDKAHQQRLDEEFAQSRSGTLMEVPDIRGPRPLSVEHGMEIINASKERALLPQERGYLDALKKEIGTRNFDLVQSTVMQPFLVSMSAKKFEVAPLIERNRQEIAQWDNPIQSQEVADVKNLAQGQQSDAVASQSKPKTEREARQRRTKNAANPITPKGKPKNGTETPQAQQAAQEGSATPAAAKPVVDGPERTSKTPATRPPVFSLSGRSVPFSKVQRMTEAAVLAEVTNRIDQFAHQPRVIVRPSAVGVLPGARDRDGVRGAVHEGSIYLFLDHLGSLADVQATLFHELLHYGLRKTFSQDGFISEMKKLYERDASIKRFSDAWVKTDDGQRAIDYGGEDYARARGVDEALALLAEPNAGAFTRTDARSAMVVRVTKWLAGLAESWGMNKLAAKIRGFKNQEAREFIQSVFRRLEQEPDLRPDGSWDSSDAAFSKKNEAKPAPDNESPASLWDATPPSLWDKFVYQIQDRHINLKRVQEAINEVSAIPEQFDAYQKEELYHGRVAARAHKFLDREMRPLLMDMKLKGISMDELEAYLWARHAPERNAQIAKINPEMPEGGSGLTDAEVATYMSGGDVLDKKGDLVIKGLKQEDKNRLEALAARVDAINAGTKQLLLQYGLEGSDSIAAWDKTYKHYVPLHRAEMEGVTPIGQGFSVKGDASKRAMGSKRRVVDILAHVALQREAAITRGEKNRVGLALYGLALQNKNADFWEVDKVPKIRVVDKKTGLVTEVPDPIYKNKANALVVRVGGQDRVVLFNERNDRAMRTVETLKNLDMQQFGEIMGTVAHATRYFAAVNTQYNPVFGIVNGLRDVQSAALNLSSTPLAGRQSEVLAAVPNALKAIWKIEQGGVAGNQYDQLYDDMKMAGGTTGYREMFRMGSDRAEALQKEIDALDAGDLRKSAEFILEQLDHYNTAIENAARLAAYKVAVESGLSQDKSASIAKNLTVNFNRKGKIGREAGAWYAFFNAAIQGTARTVETLSGPAGKRIIMSGVAIGVIQAIVGMAAMGDDEWLDDIPEFVKQRNFIIPVGNHNYVQVPMPLGFNVLPNMGRIFTELAMSKGKKASTKLLDLFSALVDGVNPLGGAPLAQMVAPTIFDPIVALSQNKDFAGRAIFKEDSNPLQPTPGFSRARDSSSTVSRTIAKGINSVTFGTKYTPGLLSPTPDQIDYIFGTLTGGVGREANKAYQTVEKLAKGENVPEYKKPLVGRFFGATDEDAAVSAKFWTIVKDINVHESELKGMRKDHVDSSQYRLENPQSNLVSLANFAERDVARLRADRHKIEFDEKLSEVDRTKKLKEKDEKILAKMKRFNERVSAKEHEYSITDQWARALAEGDDKGATKQQERLDDWNRKNPNNQIQISPETLRERAMDRARKNNGGGGG